MKFTRIFTKISYVLQTRKPHYHQSLVRFHCSPFLETITYLIHSSGAL